MGTGTITQRLKGITDEVLEMAHNLREAQMALRAIRKLVDDSDKGMDIGGMDGRTMAARVGAVLKTVGE